MAARGASAAEKAKHARASNGNQMPLWRGARERHASYHTTENPMKPTDADLSR